MLIKFLIEHIVCTTLKLQLSLGRIVQFKDYTRIEGRECSLKLTNFGCYCLIRFWSYSFQLDDDRFHLVMILVYYCSSTGVIFKKPKAERKKFNI